MWKYVWIISKVTVLIFAGCWCWVCCAAFIRVIPHTLFTFLLKKLLMLYNVSDNCSKITCIKKVTASNDCFTPVPLQALVWNSHILKMVSQNVEVKPLVVVLSVYLFEHMLKGWISNADKTRLLLRSFGTPWLLSPCITHLGCMCCIDTSQITTSSAGNENLLYNNSSYAKKYFER